MTRQRYPRPQDLAFDPLPVVALPDGFLSSGGSTAVNGPMKAKTMNEICAIPWVWVSGMKVVRMADPMTVVPIEDPGLETHLDTPDSSPWSFSGKLDCTTLTDEVTSRRG